MIYFRSYDRSQGLLLPPDLNEWVADDDLAHFIVEACERVDMHAFQAAFAHFLLLAKEMRQKTNTANENKPPNPSLASLNQSSASPVSIYAVSTRSKPNGCS